MTRLKPVFNEIAPRRVTSFWSNYFDPEDIPTHILRSEGCHGAGMVGLFRLYNEMEEKDGHLFAVLQTRKNGVLRCPRKIVAASFSERDLEVAQAVEEALGQIQNFDQSLLHMLDALGKGLSVQEVLWEVRDGRVWVKELKSRAPGRFIFAPDGSLQLSPDYLPQITSPIGIAYPLPDRKFVRFTFGGLYDNLYGRGLCARAYWYYWFKKNNLKFWVLFNEKFGAPTVIGKYRPGASDEERDRLLEILDSLQNDTGITIPESVTLELLEAQRSGNTSTYRELADWCNDEMSKIVLGATLTSGEGRSGSNALGQVHEQVRNEYVQSDARALENVINGQLVRWIVDYNFGVDVAAPRLVIDTTSPDVFETDIQIDKQLIGLGVPLPKAYFYEKYKRPAPQAAEPALCYDDQNLFQYHLQFGIVTVNEVRQRLGMPPVPWGNVRVVSSASQKSGGTKAAVEDKTSLMETAQEKEVTEQGQ